jgi:hypothetical protein
MSTSSSALGLGEAALHKTPKRLGTITSAEANFHTRQTLKKRLFAGSISLDDMRTPPLSV